MKTQKEREKYKKNGKNSAGRIMLPGFRLHYNDRVIKKVCTATKTDTPVEQGRVQK